MSRRLPQNRSILARNRRIRLPLNRRPTLTSDRLLRSLKLGLLIRICLNHDNPIKVFFVSLGLLLCIFDSFFWFAFKWIWILAWIWPRWVQRFKSLQISKDVNHILPSWNGKLRLEHISFGWIRYLYGCIHISTCIDFLLSWWIGICTSFDPTVDISCGSIKSQRFIAHGSLPGRIFNAGPLAGRWFHGQGHRKHFLFGLIIAQLFVF